MEKIRLAFCTPKALERRFLIMQNYVITITRQFGSGGRDIALAVAKELGIPMYERSNIEKEAQAMDESL